MSLSDETRTELRAAVDGVKKASPDWLWEIAGLESIEEETPGLRAYLAEVSPARIRALLDENDQLRAALGRVRALRDQCRRDDESSLNTFGQHHPVAGWAADALTTALEGEA